jgi:hypothetical protein
MAAPGDHQATGQIARQVEEETVHYTGSLQTVSHKSIQVAILAGVAATGIAFGRWAIPAEHPSPGVSVTRIAPAPTELSRARAEQKLIQMDQLNDRRAALAAAAPSSRTSLSAAQRKLIQMDQADDQRAASAGAAVSSGSSLSAAERKLIQMDQADDRRAASAGTAVSSTKPLSAAERKLIQMDARDGR